MQQRRMMEIPPLAFPALVADIGGTNARFAIIPDTYGDIKNFVTVQTADYPDPAAAIEAEVLGRTSVIPKSLAIAMAGPVEGGRLTNADWEIRPRDLVDALNLEEVVVLNDFEALALALPTLGASELVRIGGDEPAPLGPRVVLGPGTGLGVAALVHGTQRFIPVAGEGGHMSFGPQTEEDFAIWPHLPRVDGRVTGETVLSGRGLAHIHQAIVGRDGSGDRLPTGEAVSNAAVAGDSRARAAVELFATYLGRFAGDLALLFLASGGVFIGGGIAPRLIDTLASGAFRAAFDDKAPHRHLVEKMPAFVITDPRPALIGLAAFARMPNRFGMTLTGRRISASPPGP